MLLLLAALSVLPVLPVLVALAVLVLLLMLGLVKASLILLGLGTSWAGWGYGAWTLCDDISVVAECLVRGDELGRLGAWCLNSNSRI